MKEQIKLLIKKYENLLNLSNSQKNTFKNKFDKATSEDMKNYCTRNLDGIKVEINIIKDFLTDLKGLL